MNNPWWRSKPIEVAPLVPAFEPVIPLSPVIQAVVDLLNGDDRDWERDYGQNHSLLWMFKHTQCGIVVGSSYSWGIGQVGEIVGVKLDPIEAKAIGVAVDALLGRTVVRKNALARRTLAAQIAVANE